MREINKQFLTGERALFHEKDLVINDTIFDDGESPLKEANNIELNGCFFRWKYPLWYANNIMAYDCKWFTMARAGVWYSNNLIIKDAMIDAPKNFRRCHNLSIENAQMPDAQETLWNCDNVSLKNVTAKGPYFAMGSSELKIDGLNLYGDYSFDGVKNMEIRNSKLMSKDAFWNSENVTVYDSFITGEYLGWNAKNLKLINCTIESLQGLCYIDNLYMENCKLINTSLAFEYSTVEATITGDVDSILNPKSGSIAADSIKKLIIEKDRVNPGECRIVCDNIDVTLDKADY